MSQKKSLIAYRGPMYFGGLLIGLAAGVGFWQARKAMMPKFHEVQDSRPETTMALGGSVRFVYGEDPQYFLPPGFPSSAVLYRRNADGTTAAISHLDYGSLVDKEPAMGPVSEEGNYGVSANIFICAEPGAAHCTKLELTHEFRVDRNATAGDDRISIDLPGLAREGLKQGDIKVEDEVPAKAEKPAENKAD